MDMAVPGRAMEECDSEGDVDSVCSSVGEARAMFANDDGRNSRDRRENMVFRVS